MPGGRKSVEDRFFSKVNKDGPKSPVDGSSCWIWMACKSKRGYGFFWNGEKVVSAYKFSYELLVGKVPDGLDLDHVKKRGCSGPSCVAPHHLEPVPHLENVLRGDAGKLKAKQQMSKLLCPAGHPYDGENLEVVTTKSRSGRARRCRECGKAQDAAHRAALKRSG